MADRFHVQGEAGQGFARRFDASGRRQGRQNCVYHAGQFAVKATEGLAELEAIEENLAK